MKNKKQAIHSKTPVWKNERPTIGLLGLMGLFWNRTAAKTQNLDVNQIGFACGQLKSPFGFKAQANILADLVSPQNVDGLVIWSDYLTHYVDVAHIQAFCEQYRPLPLVTIGLIAGFPNVLVDQYQGTYQLMQHLIDDHGYRRFACLRGIVGNREAEERYRAYMDALTAYNIPLEPDAVVIGDFKAASGKEAIRVLFDERQVDFEVFVAADDEAAIGAIEALQDRGLQVPQDVAVVGFSDEWGNYTPPLTSVRPQWYEAGVYAVEMVLALLAGEEIPDPVVLPSLPAIRQSCGCPPTLITQTEVGPLIASPEPFALAIANQRSQICALMLQTIQTSIAQSEASLGSNVIDRGARQPVEEVLEQLDPLWVEKLLDTFTADLLGPASGTFLITLEKTLGQMVTLSDNMSIWQHVISTLRRLTLPYLMNDTPLLLKAEDLWQQARVLIASLSERVWANRTLNEGRQAHILRLVGQSLITIFDIEKLVDVLAQALPTLGIPGCYLALYEDHQAPTEWAWLILAYSQNKRLTLEKGKQRFPTPDLIPSVLFPRHRRYALRVEPLYFEEMQLGFMLFEPGPPEKYIYDTLPRYVSNALHGALQYEDACVRTERLQAANHELQKAQTQLVRQEKLAVLGQLAAGVAHEMRNLLGVISNAVYFLQLKLVPADTITQEYLEIIAGRIDEAEKLISNLFNLSFIPPAKPTETNVEALIMAALTQYSPPEILTTSTDLNPNLPPILVNSEQIVQVLGNLLTNAYQAMPNGGELTLTARSDSQQVQISITDSGLGMSATVLEKIFEPLFTTKAKGIGLGLAVSKSFMTANNGHITVASVEGQGSTFTLYLPAQINPSSS